MPNGYPPPPCRRLKADRITKSIPVIHKTAVYRDPQHQQMGRAAGSAEYLVEPFEPETLVAAVRRSLEGLYGQ